MTLTEKERKEEDEEAEEEEEEGEGVGKGGDCTYSFPPAVMAQVCELQCPA